MSRAWNDFVIGWKEVRWITRFSLYLLPSVSLAISLAYLVDSLFPVGTKFPNQPSDLQIMLALIAGWAAILLATVDPKKAFCPSYRSNSEPLIEPASPLAQEEK